MISDFVGIKLLENYFFYFFYFFFIYSFDDIFLIQSIFDLLQWGFQNTLERSFSDLTQSEFINNFFGGDFSNIFFSGLFFVLLHLTFNL